MDAATAIKISLDTAEMIGMAYLQDLSDAELMKRPHPSCNHLNWQVGHLIVAENQMISGIAADKMPALPEGFAAKYSKETANSDDASDFASKDELFDAYKTQRAATVQVLESLSAEDLDKPTGVDYAPTVGSMLAMQANHWLMHCGQWVVVRRETGKPVVI